MKARILISMSLVCLAAFMPIMAGAQFNMDEISVETPEAPSAPEIPDIEIPSIDIPEIETPTVPDIDLPNETDLSADIPEIDTPKIDTPKVDIPEVDIPDVDTPTVDVPVVDAPDTPSVDTEDIANISEELKNEIQQMKNQAAAEIMSKLKKDELLNSEANMKEAIQTVFEGREFEALYQAMNVLRQRRLDYEDGKLVDRSDDFNVAKTVFKKFSPQSTAVLQKEYSEANGPLKGNILQVLGSLKEEPAAEDILIEALNDKSIGSDEETGETDGEPMRVCDLAYNQLVLRNEITGVLRTLGPIHRIEVRDYHIEILKSKLMPLAQ